MFYKCFMMFNNVLGCLVSHSTICIWDRKSLHNAAEIGDTAAGIADNTGKVIPR